MEKPPAVPHQVQTKSQFPRNTTDAKLGEASDAQPTRAAVFKVPKRKRLVKACDACHKSKRRCDGTAPCSNCYYASKECTYTDATGRPVPAPNASQTPGDSNVSAHDSASINLSAPATASSSYQAPESFHTEAETRFPETLPANSDAGPSISVPNRPSKSSGRSPVDEVPQRGAGRRLDIPRDRLPPCKRLKNDREPSNHRDEIGLDPAFVEGRQGFYSVGVAGAGYQRMDGSRTSGEFNKRVMHELVNLFFAHCHPHRLIIHSASFYADLCRGRVPPYLLNAVCAVAAPLSHNPLVRETPIRQSGEKFANAALADLFDAEGRLLQMDVAAAQALTLVQTYNVYKESSMQSDLQFYDLALRILHSMHAPDSSSNVADTRSPSSDELYLRTIQKECARRTFWLIHMVELLGAVFTRRPTAYNKDELGGVRLPCDEASFDLALQVPPDRVEYLDSPALKTWDTSEFGHLIRVATILQDIESNNIDSPDPNAVAKCEEQLVQWVNSLADHLRYSPENLRTHLSLWETGSNTSTWCYCFMHILHACAVLALSSVRMNLGEPACRDYESALQAFPAIIRALGPRARNSILMGSVLWMQYCGPHASDYNISASRLDDNHPAKLNGSVSSPERETGINAFTSGLTTQLHTWIKEWEEFWGPARMHNGGSTLEIRPKELQRTHQQSQLSTPAVSIVSARVSQPPEATIDRKVPDLVIDTVLQPEEQHSASPFPAFTTAPTSHARNQLFLPSLKSSGLLDVIPDDPLGGRSSGASTPVKHHPSWSLAASGSPRPPLLSPGLPASVASVSSGSAPVSPQPHSPGFQSLHTRQVRLKVPSFYQTNIPARSPEIVDTPIMYEETGARDTRAEFSSHQGM